MPAPFDNPVLRRAMQLSLDRKSFIDILGEGQYDIGGVLQPPPEGIWGMPQEIAPTADRLRAGRAKKPGRSSSDDAIARLLAPTIR